MPFRTVAASRKVKAVLRLLEGAPLEELASELDVSSDRLLRWRQEFIAGGRAHLMRRRDGNASHWRRRRGKLLQWSAVVVGLVVLIWVVTRIFAGAPGAD
jgi:hypothetical protein